MAADLKMTGKFGELAGEDVLGRVCEALVKKGINVFVAENKEDARKKALEIIPERSEVMDMTSVTLAESGLMHDIRDSGRFYSTRKKLMVMDEDKEDREMKKLGAAPEWCVGSVHAVTEDGSFFIASNTGSQLPAYAYSAGKVVFLVGTQKIVRDFEEAIKRIYEYVLPLEDERAQKAYKIHSGVSKILIINKEIEEGRITVIFIREKIGF